MLLTCTVLRPDPPAAVVPWEPVGATWWQAGRSSDGRSRVPDPDGRVRSVLAIWRHEDDALTGPPVTAGVERWHAVLDVRSSHGDVVMAGGARPFDGLVAGPAPAGAVALVTVAGSSADEGREREFARRFQHVGRDLARAPGHLLTLVHSPTGTTSIGPVVVLSVWRDLAAGLHWAYTGSRPHTAAVARQADARLVGVSASLRCAVVSSRGSLGGLDHGAADSVRG
ncbi:antibiotic biosynthesis monooxygenase [Aquipuribacter sp. SD81]|uniref:antibiotic biosynthesis monooxygenase n=1 Tax=Aquipuribacter sp. SD81 TaxID=3127703 RepID=UPI00301975F7